MGRGKGAAKTVCFFNKKAVHASEERGVGRIMDTAPNRRGRGGIFNWGWWWWWGEAKQKIGRLVKP